MPRKPKAPHVVFGKGKAVIANALLPNRCALQWYSPMHCQNCGELFPMPAGLMEWCTAVMNAFIKAHADCKKGEPTNGKPA
ncbi:MAG: hypothetical protein U0Y68_08120 [Blastocatellia bacterium]